MTDRRYDGGEQIVRVPVAPAAEQTPGTEDGLTFYDTLGGDERIAGEGGAASRGAPPAIAMPPSQESPSTGRQERVAKPPSRAAVGEKARRPRTASRRPASRRSGAAHGRADSRRRAQRPSAHRHHRRPRAWRSRSRPRPCRPRVRRRARATGASRCPRRAIRARPTRCCAGCKRKGYEAFVLKVRRRGETFYRVRVGHYGSLEEAQQVVSRLRREPGVPEAFVASD